MAREIKRVVAPMDFRNYPSNPSRYSGVFRLPGGEWIKYLQHVASQLDPAAGTIRSPFNTEEEAKAHLALYRLLRGAGVFHPQTRFTLAPDDKGRPTIRADMPHLQQLSVLDEPPELARRIGEIMQKITNRRVRQSGDALLAFNYGHDDGKVYLLDLDIAQQLPNQDVLEWYRSRRARKFSPQKSA